jgi:hypothetical protein
MGSLLWQPVRTLLGGDVRDRYERNLMCPQESLRRSTSRPRRRLSRLARVQLRRPQSIQADTNLGTYVKSTGRDRLILQAARPFRVSSSGCQNYQGTALCM